MTNWITGVVVCLLAVVPPAHANPITLSTLDLVGTSQLLSPTLLRLTPNYDTNTVGGEPAGDPPAGAAWTPTKLDVADPFAISFSFHMWNPDLDGQIDPSGDGSAGDGIAFVIQNYAPDVVGRGAGGLGFMGFPSVAVMFDTYMNAPAYGDPNGNYIAVNTRGATDFNVPHHVCTDGELSTDPVHYPDLPGVHCDGSPTVAMTTDPIPRLDGDVHTVLIVYNPGTLVVYLDTDPDPILTAYLNLANVLSLLDGDAYLGFTAGTRGSFQDQDILGFTYAQTPEPATAAELVAGLMFFGVLAWKRKRTAAL